MAVLVVTSKPEVEPCNPKRRGPLPAKFARLQREKPKHNFELTVNGLPVLPGRSPACR